MNGRLNMASLTVQECAQRVRRSEETVRRWIRNGKLPASQQDGQYVIKEEDLMATNLVTQDDDSNTQEVAHLQEVIDIFQNQVEYLKSELSNEEQHITELERQLFESSQRSDTIVLSLTQQIDKKDRLLEDSRNKKRLNIFRKLFLRKPVPTEQYLNQ